MWLKETFLQYLDEWEREVAEEKTLKDKEKSRMMLSRETREGLRITGKNNEPAVLIIMHGVALSQFCHFVSWAQRS